MVVAWAVAKSKVAKQAGRKAFMVTRIAEDEGVGEGKGAPLCSKSAGNGDRCLGIPKTELSTTFLFMKNGRETAPARFLNRLVAEPAIYDV
jgi:hypothetical protein